MVCQFIRAKLLKWLEISNLLSWLTLEMINLDDYRANSQKCHELEKLKFYVESFSMDFLSLCF